ncbi:SRPBCC family protein [Hufsiella ginkgonis]|uniref:Cell division protein n=1 Tax=Hufsiella ginkgonis TaxID=2695274 RepID=A0A7K1Y1I6_9SPHI|nr:SRPBCC family protein [Hufsiella ginkgonis]MXV17104.1 cell division protein [Hufsiella ginkgonis]
MPIIHLETKIHAPVSACFDLSRDIGLHQASMAHTAEKATAGVTSGLIELGETVSWKARHFGMILKMTVHITEMRPPVFFADEMLRGPFKAFRHTHTFTRKEGFTLMRDELVYRSPGGMLGRLADKLFLENYIMRLLEIRNTVIKQKAETTHT